MKRNSSKTAAISSLNKEQKSEEVDTGVAEAGVADEEDSNSSASNTSSSS